MVRGEVTVNGKRVTEPGSKADPERDHIKVRGKLITSGFARKRNATFLSTNFGVICRRPPTRKTAHSLLTCCPLPRAAGFIPLAASTSTPKD